MEHLRYNKNGIIFRVVKGIKVLDVTEYAVNTEVWERDYKDACCRPCAQYRIHILLSYNNKKYRINIIGRESRDADISIEMFTELGFKIIANVDTLGFIGDDYQDLHSLYFAKNTTIQREITKSAIERMIEYIALLG